MIRTYKYRLYPTNTQRADLWAAKGYYCALHNAAIEERRTAYRQSRVAVTYSMQSAELKTMVRPASTTFKCSQQVLRRVDKAYSAFFRRVKAGEKPGYPRFKASRRYRGFEFPVQGDLDTVRNTKRVNIPGIGKVRIRLHNDRTGHYKSVALVNDLGKWYAHFRVEAGDPEPIPETGQSVGIDVGLHHFAALDNGEIIANPRHLQKAQKDLRRKQRKLARCQRNSKQRRKVRFQLAKAHQKVRSQRRDFLHKVTKSLVSQYDAFYLEDLRVKNMLRNHSLARSISDAGWSLFRELLTYKAESAGRQVVLVPAQGTSQTCPQCGEVKAKQLSERQHICPCGFVADRDVAAAMVIKRRGQRLAGLTQAAGPYVLAEV